VATMGIAPAENSRNDVRLMIAANFSLIPRTETFHSSVAQLFLLHHVTYINTFSFILSHK
jgi:hypothetical protein